MPGEEDKWYNEKENGEEKLVQIVLYGQRAQLWLPQGMSQTQVSPVESVVQVTDPDITLSFNRNITNSKIKIKCLIESSLPNSCCNLLLSI